MPNFRYTALNASGERVAGVLAGASEQAVLAELESRRLVPIGLDEQLDRKTIMRRGISTRNLAFVYGQVADLLRAGVPLLRALRLIARRKSSPQIARAFRGLADRVSEGAELAIAMEESDAFPPVHVAMVRAGEKGGFLDDVLAKLSELLEAQAELKSKLLGNLLYPAVLALFGFGVLAAIFKFFIPKFRPIFATLEDEGQLPKLTSVVLNLGDLVAERGVLLLALGVIALIIAWRMVRTPAVGERLVRIQLSLPIIGPLTRSWCVARFCRVLGTLLANAIPMLAAMEIARDAVGNVFFARAIDNASDAVRRGESLAPPLRSSSLFPDDIIEMIDVAEAANNLDEVLLTIAGSVERRIDSRLTVAVRLAEPMILIVLGLAIGVVAIALLTPLSQMSSLAG